MFKRLIKNHKGTAEVIGSVMFIVILLFFFTNVYLWHDAATKEMNDFYVKRIATQMDVTLDDAHNLIVTAKSSDVVLSRLWVVDKTTNSHSYYDLPSDFNLEAGTSVKIIINSATTPAANDIRVSYDLVTSHTVRFVVLNTLGVTSVMTYTP
jgi:hypothetical protein